MNHTALRDRIAGEAIKPQVPAFVELDMISSRTAAGECIIEIEKADARMKIILKGNCPDIALGSLKEPWLEDSVDGEQAYLWGLDSTV